VAVEVWGGIGVGIGVTIPGLGKPSVGLV